jgi:hypothetical protein
MDDRQRAGGIAALIEAATFVVGFVMALTTLADFTTGDPTPAESVEFLVDNQAALYVWNTIIFLVFGVALVVLALAVNERLKPDAPSLAPTATAFGLIWAGLVLAAGMIADVGIGTVVDLHGDDPGRAVSVWSSLDAVQNGLGGGIELVGGVWLLLISWAGLRTGVLPRALDYLGLVAGAAGVITIIPALEDVGAVFGLGLIVWFAWIGVVMLGDGRSGAPGRDDDAREPDPAP